MVLALVLTFLPQLSVNLLGAVLIVLFGFFFVVVSSRITGEIGVSANPISGMTIAALIGTTTIFLLIGWTGVDHRVGAISHRRASSRSPPATPARRARTSRPGFLVGATPQRQQIGIIVGAVTSALAIGWTLTLLNNTYTNIVPEPHPGVTLEAAAPGSSDRSVTTLGERMRHDGREWDVVRVNLPTQGIQPGKYLLDPGTHEVAYLVDPGIGGRIREIDGRPITKLDSPQSDDHGAGDRRHPDAEAPLGPGADRGLPHDLASSSWGSSRCPIAVGVYLPISTSAAMFAGGVVRWLVERRTRSAERSIAEVESGPGVLFSSGLIAGGAIAGIAIAGIAAALVRRAEAAKVPAADYLAHVAGLESALGRLRAESISWRSAPSRCLAARSIGSRGADACRRAEPVSPSIRARIIHGSLVLGFCMFGAWPSSSATAPLPVRGAAEPASVVRGTRAGERLAVRRGDVHGWIGCGRPRRGASEDDWWRANLGRMLSSSGLWSRRPPCSALVVYLITRDFRTLLAPSSACCFSANYRPRRLTDR